MSKAIDTLKTHRLIHKLTLTNVPNIIFEFILNYIKGQRALNTNGTLSKLKPINTGVPPKEFRLQPCSTYATDIKITASHTKHRKGPTTHSNIS